MALHKIKDFDPNYKDHFDGNDVIGWDLYAGDEKIGSVDNVLVDDDGSFRYLVINTGVWILGKKVLMPIGNARIDHQNHRVYAKNLSKSQVENLPEYDENHLVDYDYEERVRGVYRPAATTGADMPATDVTRDRDTYNYDRDTYNYDRDPDLYSLNEADHQSLRLYQERLIANKTRQKTGEVIFGKQVQTETAQVSVPVTKERVVIERVPVDSDHVVTPEEASFTESEVARIEVYEEVPDIQKETFVREEVRVKKVVDQDMVTAEDQVRREELDLDVEGNPIVEKNL